MDRFVIDGGRTLSGRVSISGSKNATLPLMAAALLADTPTVIRNVPVLRDVETMAAVLRSLGAEVCFADHVMRIDPAGFSICEAPYDIVRKMRASVYVMAPMLARLGQARVSLPGGCAIGPRPIDLHLKGFEHLGATISLEHGNILATTDQLKGAEFPLTGASGSSVGATCNVVMAATLAQGTTVIHGAAREPEIIELLGFLKKMGAQIEGAGTGTLTIEGVSRLSGIDHAVVCDRIEAGTFMTAAAVTRGDVVIEGSPVEHMEATIDKLREIGVLVDTVEGGVRVHCSSGDFHPTSIQTLPYPGFPTDMQAQFTALLATVPGQSIIKETIYVDRFIHIAELNRMGANIFSQAGTATINGVEKLSGAPVMASDLRASAALIVAALCAEGQTVVNRIYHIDRGYEQIEKKFEKLGAKVQRVSDGGPEEPVSAGPE